MPGFMEITAEDVAVMRDGGGGRFTLFVDSLIRASAACLSIPPAAINTTVRVNIGDGGVDTEVAADGHDPANRLCPSTAWQYKAIEYTRLSNEVIREEVAKPYARELISRGYGYRLCLCDDPPATTKAAKLEILRAVVRGIRQDAPDPQILSISDLVAWANQYPAVVAKSRRIAITDFVFFDTWSRQATAVTPTFVPTGGASSVATAVVEHVEWSKRPSQIALTIFGEAGVGKTRSVFEAMRSLDNHRELVIYTRDESVARNIAVGIANDQAAHAILVADECLPPAVHAIQETLRGAENRVRVITIDNAQERRSLNPQLELSELTDAEVEGVLAANYPNVPAENRRRYAHLSSGFLRIAADMCSRDQEIRARGDIAPVLDTVGQYYETRIDREDRTAVEVLALIDRAGYLSDVAGELDQLCGLVHLHRNDVQRRLERIRIAPGFVVNAGRYCYVTPKIIAIIAFQIAWERWIAPDPDGFLRRIPEELVLPFQRRVSRSGSAEVSGIVAQFFRRRTESLAVGALGTESEARRLFALTEAEPSTYIPLLRRLISGIFARPDGGLAPHIRRQVVWIAERTAIFPEFFAEAEEILFTLAAHETEPSIGNNASKTWQSLFSIYLSGTSLSVSERVGVLRRRFDQGSTAEKILAIGAIRMALENRNVKVMAPPMFGRRVPPQEWRPQNQQELRGSLSAYLDLLSHTIVDNEPTVRDAAENALIAEAAYISRAGGLDLVAKALSRTELSEDLRARLLSSIDDALESKRRVGRDVPKLDETTSSWMESLQPTTLHGRIVAEITAEPWSHRHDEPEWRSRVEQLATELLESEAAFEKELQWLCSPQARATAELGMAVGRLDVSLSKLSAIVAGALKHRSDGFARGYVYGVAQHDSVDNQKLNAALDDLQAADPELAVFVAIPGGDKTNAFSRALRSVGDGKLRPGMLRNLTVWVGSRKTSRDECRAAVEVLTRIAEQNKSSEAVDTAVEFISYRIHGLKNEAEALGELQTTFSDETLDAIWRIVRLSLQFPGRESFWLVEILKVIAATNPAAACEVVANMLVSDEYLYIDSAEKLVSQLVISYPQQFMAAVGDLMVHDPRFFIGKFNFLGLMPVAVVTDWLKKVGVQGARPLARHLVPPSLNENGQPVLNPLTEFVLREFEDDERTFREFVAGTHSLQIYAGSYAEARAKEAAVAKAFLNHPLRRVREWANIEIEQAEHEVRISRIEEEEMNLE